MRSLLGLLGSSRVQNDLFVIILQGDDAVLAQANLILGHHLRYFLVIHILDLLQIEMQIVALVFGLFRRMLGYDRQLNVFDLVYVLTLHIFLRESLLTTGALLIVGESCEGAVLLQEGQSLAYGTLLAN